MVPHTLLLIYIYQSNLKSYFEKKTLCNIKKIAMLPSVDVINDVVSARCIQ